MAPKTVHITNSWHPKSGGIRTFYQALLAAANHEQRELHLVVPGPADATETVGSHGFIHHLRAPFAPGSDSYRMLYPQLYLSPRGRLNRLLHRIQPDLVEICDKYTLNYLGGLLRIGLLPGINFKPVVVGLSCERLTDSVRHYWSGDGHITRWFSAAYLRWLYFPLADHHIAVSSFVASELASVANGHKVDRAVWLGPMGVDYAAFASVPHDPRERAVVAERAGASPDAYLLIYAGRLAKEKNIPLLFHAMRELQRLQPDRETHLLMAGDGDQRAELRTLADQLAPASVHFLGHQSKQQLITLLHTCDAFVHPNPSEPFGIGPLEAMAAGLALVAPDSGGVRNYANNENAWLANPVPHAFATAIQSATTPSATRDAKVARARATAESFNWQSAATHYLRLYDDIYHVTQTTQLAQASIHPLFRSTPDGALTLSDAAR